MTDEPTRPGPHGDADAREDADARGDASDAHVLGGGTTAVGAAHSYGEAEYGAPSQRRRAAAARPARDERERGDAEIRGAAASAEQLGEATTSSSAVHSYGESEYT